jgi:putative transposase
MGSKGDCFDNAVAESFFATLENDLLRRRSFATRQDARTAVFDYIEAFSTRSGSTPHSATCRRSNTRR